MSDQNPISPQDEATVAEYSLGLLPPEECAAFEARLLAEQDLRAALSAWEKELASLTHGIAPVLPRARVKRGIDTELFGSETTGLWSSLGFWRLLSGVSAAAVLAMALIMAQPQGSATPQYFVAEIKAENSDLQIAVLYDRTSGALTLNRTKGGAGSQRALELWIITAGQAPVSLGVLATDQRSHHSIGAGIPDLKGAILAISDEPLGGSTTGQPTGAVLATGALISL